MIGVENVLSGKKLIAKVFRNSLKVSGVKFFTESENPFQIGIHQRSKGLSLAPHVHKLDRSLIIDTIQEILLVQKGKIKISFYAKNGKFLTKKILKMGDSVLLMDGGHGVEFLEDSRVFEVKQGPYPGMQSAKIYINK